MKSLLAVLLLLAPSAFAKGNPFAGRWDINITLPNGSQSPRWLEVVETNGAMKARFQPQGGAVRDVVDAKLDGKKLTLTLMAASQRSPATIWELNSEGEKFSGVQSIGEMKAQVAGVRAPKLNRKMPKKWSEPESLFNGKDLTGWQPMGKRKDSFWSVENGDLINTKSGDNLRTLRTFDDFKLHIEYNVPEHGNSGLYLRGRYEIQIGTEGGARPLTEMGAIYGYFKQGVDLPLKLGEWQSYDVTLVGRTVTVIRNGVKIHDNVEIPGITGGALDSNEAEPGPIWLQGDHQGLLRFRNITIQVPKK